MRYLRLMVQFLKRIVLTLRLALPKLGVGWMFALLTINFNRIAIVELGIVAVSVTAMLSMHYFLSPFQVISGRITDQKPFLGLRRTPYLFAGGVVASLIFVALPTVVHQMSENSIGAYLIGFALIIIYGIAIAFMGDSHHSLIADITAPRERGAVISVVWTFTILSTIIAAVVFNIVFEEYSFAAMQRLYNLTPLVVIGSILLGVVGVEKRYTGDELQAYIDKAKAMAPAGNPITGAMTILRENKEARGFFFFVFIAIFSIFLQDNILEVFGAEVFNMSVTETTSFQPTWGGGVLGGMLLMGILSAVFSIPKRTIAVVGCVGTAVGMLFLAFAALTAQAAWVKPALMLMGLFTGFFNIGSLSMMMDMTIEGATGMFMGLWGMAQAFGNGAASFGGGAIHTGLIETGFLSPSMAYFVIFGIEAAGMTVAGLVIWRISVTRFREQHNERISMSEALTAMEAGAAA